MLQFFKKKNAASPVWLLLFWLTTALLYALAYKGGFFLDFLETLNLYHSQSFVDFLNRSGLQIRSLYQVTQLLLYVLISIFGHHQAPWFLLFTGLHALNGFVMLQFFTRLFEKLEYRHAFSASLIGVLFFLINPVQTEVLIWKAALHYLTGTLMIFSILSWTLFYLETLQTKYLSRIGILYFLSTFTLEIFYLTPAFVFVLIIVLAIARKISFATLKNALVRIFLPLVIIWLLHWFTYYFLFHKWIAHYDVDMQSSFSFDRVFSMLPKYFIHIWSMEYFWPADWRGKFYALTEQLPFIIFAAGFFITALVAGVAGLMKKKPFLSCCLLLLVCGLLSFALVLPLWFRNQQVMLNDRYYYLPSVFLFLLLGVLVHGIRGVKLRRVIVSAYCLLCVWGTMKIVVMARGAARVFYSAIDNFRWQQAAPVILLNLPNNFDGIGIIPARNPDFFNEHLRVFGKDTVKGKVYDASSFNITSVWDGAHVTVLDSNTLKVTLNQWGTWWWFNTLGAQNYENELYRINFTDPGHEYILKLKQRPKNLVVLFYTEMQWRQADLSLVGKEQW